MGLMGGDVEGVEKGVGGCVASGDGVKVPVEDSERFRRKKEKIDCDMDTLSADEGYINE